MHFILTPMTREDARMIGTWHYDGPFATYDPGDDADDLLDTRSPFFVARDADDASGAIVGFCCFGTAAEIGVSGEPRLYSGTDSTLGVGLGLRPDLTGHGIGLSYMQAILAFGRERFAPAAFHLFVLSWNRRARRVYERAGFVFVGTLVTPYGSEFLEMRLDPADSVDSVDSPSAAASESPHDR